MSVPWPSGAAFATPTPDAESAGANSWLPLQISTPVGKAGLNTPVGLMRQWRIDGVEPASLVRDIANCRKAWSPSRRCRLGLCSLRWGRRLYRRLGLALLGV